MPRLASLWDRFNEKYEIVEPGGCWVWMAAADAYGYGKIGIATGRSARAHRISWRLHNGPIPNHLYVLHRCDNPCCVNPSHLYLGTQADNMADMVSKGRSSRHGAPSGEKNGMAKLTDIQVERIRLLNGALTQREISKQFGVSQGHVSEIMNHIKRREP